MLRWLEYTFLSTFILKDGDINSTWGGKAVQIKL